MMVKNGLAQQGGPLSHILGQSRRVLTGALRGPPKAVAVRAQALSRLASSCCDLDDDRSIAVDVVCSARPPASAGGDKWRRFAGHSAGGAPAPRPIPAWPGGVRDRTSGSEVADGIPGSPALIP